ncbi:hypothetical protein PMIN01_02797 [Paraphaeosphaeria minitans]|uniref:Uncharacterized protein n=1 Tax=Paraphaeosphaeria minitans TaxID=565426 RepID=A0A9P6GQS1_9PLEO|nr:hypothetical protein PMIN01_02797 [Paraphaeosphaeria minitans]
MARPKITGLRLAGMGNRRFSLINPIANVAARTILAKVHISNTEHRRGLTSMVTRDETPRVGVGGFVGSPQCSPVLITDVVEWRRKSAVRRLASATLTFPSGAGHRLCGYSHHLG